MEATYLTSHFRLQQSSLAIFYVLRSTLLNERAPSLGLLSLVMNTPAFSLPEALNFKSFQLLRIFIYVCA